MSNRDTVICVDPISYSFILLLLNFFSDDDNRILLRHLPGKDVHNEFINASFVDVSSPNILTSIL